MTPPDLAALGVGLQQVDDLDARFEHLDGGRLVLEGRRFAVDRPTLVGRGRLAPVDGLAEDVEHAPQRACADGHFDAVPERLRLHAAGKPFAPREHDAAHRVRPFVTGDFHHPPFPLYGHDELVVDLGQAAVRKRDVYDGTEHLRDNTDRSHTCSSPALRRCACAPEEISVISCVIAP